MTLRDRRRAQRGVCSKRTRDESGCNEIHTLPPITRSKMSSSDRNGFRSPDGSSVQTSSTVCAEANRLPVVNDCSTMSFQYCPTCGSHPDQDVEPSDRDLVLASVGRDIGRNLVFQLSQLKEHPLAALRNDSRRQTRHTGDPANVYNSTLIQQLGDAGTEIAERKNLLQSSSAETSAVKMENVVLQEGAGTLKNNLHRVTRCIADHGKLICYVAGDFVRKVAQEHGCSNIVQSSQRDTLTLHKFIVSRLLSLRGSINLWVSEQRIECSHKQETSSKLKSRQLSNPEHIGPICGSYSDEAATPKLLDFALSNAKTAIKEFLKKFMDCIESRQNKPWGPLDDVFFARKKHFNYYVKSVVNDAFFEAFENESFNTIYGVSRFLDPNRRQTAFYSYYRCMHEQNSAGDIEDPQFEEFCEAKEFLVYNSLGNMTVDEQELPGDANLYSSFRAAAGSVWLLHKLAFSFEPPAFIFRVERGADLDPHYMKSVVDLDDNENFVPKVGFMITPGLRLRKTVMPCEVYLAGKAYTEK